MTISRRAKPTGSYNDPDSFPTWGSKEHSGEQLDDSFQIQSEHRQKRLNAIASQSQISTATKSMPAFRLSKFALNLVALLQPGLILRHLFKFQPYLFVPVFLARASTLQAQGGVFAFLPQAVV